MAKVLMVANSDWIFYNFRLPLVQALQRQGHDVTLVCPLDKYASELQKNGCRCIHWSLSRHGLNPFQEAVAAIKLLRIYLKEQPEVVHHFTIKPNLYGSLAIRLMRFLKLQINQESPVVINTFMGLGFAFSPHPVACLLRFLILPLLGLALRLPNIWAVFLNREDLLTFVQLRLISSKQALLIVSDGVDVKRFRSDGRSRTLKNASTPVVLMASRLFWDKGVGVFVEAAQRLQERGVRVQCWLAGEPDVGNPSCVSSDKLAEWQQDGLIRWLGHRADMPELLRRASIAVLPSYYNEGVPRILLEAAAAGLPLVATDIEGCRLVVRPGVNGLLVPVRDSEALSVAIEQLVRDAHLRQQMGQASQKIAVEEFDEQKILRQWLAFYERLLKPKPTLPLRTVPQSVSH